MQIVFVIAILLLMLSSAAYFSYLFFQRDGLQRLGFLLMATGFVCQTMVITWRFGVSGSMPANNMHQTLSLVAWSVVGVYLVFQLRAPVKILGAYAAPLAAIILLMALQFPQEPMLPKELLKGFWLVVHILAIFIGHAAFALAAGVGVLYLLQERSIKKKTHGFFFKRLPSLDLLDSSGYACIVVGFTMLTIGLVAGLVFAKIVWGRFWAWDPKEVWSAVTWIFYAVLLHERLAVGWRGRRAAVMAIVGFGVLLFSFFGVNLMLKGHHGQFMQF